MKNYYATLSSVSRDAQIIETKGIGGCCTVSTQNKVGFNYLPLSKLFS